MEGHLEPRLRRRGERVAPLSFGQERLWFIEAAMAGTATYNLPLLMRWTEAVDLDALRRALRLLAQRHEVLRTTYRIQDDHPVQVIRPATDVPVTVVDSAARPTDEELAVYARRPFDLSARPPLRCVVWRGAPDGDTVLLTLHHIAADGWSLAALFDDLAEAYDAALAGRAPRSRGLAVQYADFASWERESYVHLGIDERVARRAGELRGVPTPLLLAGHRVHEAVTVGARRGAQHRFGVSPGIWRQVRELATRLRATPFVVLLAAFQEVLRRWSVRDEFLVGTVVANRPHPALEGLVGFFANTVPLRCDLDPDMSFEALCARVRTEAFQALAHQRIPFERLTASLRAEQASSRDPLIQVGFALQNMPTPRADRSRWQPPVLLPTGTARFDVMLLLEEGSHGLDGTVEYDLGCYSPAVAQRLSENYLALLAAAVSDPGARLARLPLTRRPPNAPPPGTIIGPRRDLSRLNPPAGAMLLDIVAERLSSGPGAPAVTGGGATVSRGELDRWAWDVAHLLVGQGVGAGTIVPVLAARGPALVAGWLGTLRTGAAYLPLNLDTPPDRLEFLLRESRAQLVVADEAGRAALRAVRRGWAVADLHAVRGTGPGASTRPVPFTGGETAVVIHTSGSTGRPKCVPVPHRGLANTALWWADDANLGPADRLLCAVGTAFDPATFMTFQALAAGSELVLADDVERRDPSALVRLLRGATVAAMTPSLIRSVLDVGQEDAGGSTSGTLRLLYLGGESLPRPLVTEWQRRWGVPVRNVYGPTEVSCTSTSAAVDADGKGAPAIGRPIWNTRAYILGPCQEELPPGAPGELYLAGAGVSAGYLDRPELTESAFLADPYAGPDEPAARMYRTGDRVVLRPDGLIEHLGRVDDQVKILGLRVELDGVARLLEESPGVLAANVHVEGEPPRLVASVVLSSRDAPPPTHDDVVLPLRRWLPAAVLPAEVRVLGSLPLTANDKVDLEALRAMPTTLLPRTARGQGRLTPSQLWAAERFISALAKGGHGGNSARKEDLAAGDDFFELGGHSLLAVRMLAEAERECGAPLPLRGFLDEPTVAGLARLREAATGAAAQDPCGAGGGARPIVADANHPATSIQQRLAFLDRVAGLRDAYLAPSIIELTGDLDRDALRRATQLILGRHPALRCRFWLDHASGQVVYRTDGPAPTVTETDGRGWTASQLASHLKKVCWAPFDLGKDALARAEIIARADRWFLVIVVHHIVADGWSQRVLMEQLGAAYRSELSGRRPRLPPAVHPAALPDRWLELSSQERAARLQALVTRLRQAPTDIDLPHDRPRPVVQSTRAAVRHASVDSDTAARLRSTLAELGCTSHMAAAALLGVALARTGGQRDFLFAFPCANRDSAAAADAVCMRVNTLVQRVDLTGDPTWRQLLARVREESLASYRCAEVPFEALVAELHPRRDLTRPPVTPVLVTASEGVPALPDLGSEARARHVPPPDLRIKYELELTMKDGTDGIGFALAYCTGLFDAATVDALLDELVDAARDLSAHQEAVATRPARPRPPRTPTVTATAQTRGQRP